MDLLLIRHGRAACASARGLINRRGIERWRAAYDLASLPDEERPPAALLAAVRDARVVAASDLPRAVASATRLWPDRAPLLTPLFREIPLPIPTWGPRRAPLAIWELLIHLQWITALAVGRNAPPDALAQIRLAAEWCREACHAVDGDSAPVAVVTHGVLRRLLADQLVTDAWRPTSRRRSYGYWSVWTFEPPQ